MCWLFPARMDDPAGFTVEVSRAILQNSFAFVIELAARQVIDLSSNTIHTVVYIYASAEQRSWVFVNLCVNGLLHI